MEGEEEQLQQTGIAPVPLKAKKRSTFTPILTVAFCLFLLFMAMGVGFGLNRSEEGEPTPGGTAGNVTCASWDSAPVGYQEQLTQAANKAGIQPALLGAILLSEHDDHWPSGPGVDGIWARGGNAKGPFQIENWENKWRQVTQVGMSSKAVGNPEDMYDSGLTTAVSLSIGMKAKSIPINTSEERYIKFAGMFHNRGSKAAYEWAEGGFDLSNPPANTTNPGWEWGANDYALRTWASFQNLNEGCQDNNLVYTSGNKIVQTALDEIGVQANPKDCVKYNPPSAPCQLWCAAFVSWVYNQAGYKINPSIYSAAVLKTYFEKNQTIIENPKPSDIQAGDIIFCREQCNNTTSTITHRVAIAKEAGMGSSIKAISGNTRKDLVKEQTYEISKILAVGRWGKSTQMASR